MHPRRRASTNRKEEARKEIWDSLKTRYLGSKRVKMASVQTLKSEFNVLRMKKTETIDEFTGKISRLVSKFTTLEVALEDSSLVKMFLDSVSDKYLPIVVGIEQFQDLETMQFEEAIGRMKVYEEQTTRLRENNNNTNGQLLLTHVEWKARQKRHSVDNSSMNKGRKFGSIDRGRWRGRGCGTERQNSAGGTSNTGNGNRDKSHIKCFTWNKMGHYTSECRRKGHDDETHLTCAIEEELTLIMVVSQKGTRTR
ncbi:uncharacterized protein LOC116403422 [Cucumis sativus]|uniref:uncharacterized protein LOC116403422 n=1 Tax=Cucumis sativus TaxID=3659 RepID=UPI0012F4AD62|nr:uncharacterized protein LOC116403422 [Cucumis sativus]